MNGYFITISGIVQSVGFRPTIHRLFKNYTGWVRNDAGGVEIYLETPLSKDEVESLITNNAPPNSKIEKISTKQATIKKPVFDHFFIRHSKTQNNSTPAIPPDLGICDECLKELFDKNNRRYLHPFINCTNCGPRFSIIQSSPYDRDKTTMKQFKMCDRCKEEFTDPKNRRFHAQPICCKDCGPSYFLVKNKKPIAKDLDAIKIFAQTIKSGGVGLLKGIGGYHLICNPFNKEATKRIINIKRRENKPFAVIAENIETVKELCFVNKKEEQLLKDPSKPILLLKAKNHQTLSNIRFGSPFIGVMLAYAPIHHLLFHFSGLKLLVATSANITEKPLLYKDNEAIRFEGVDEVLTNNRRIVRPLEDSIAAVVNSNRITYRFARGFAPGVFLRKTRPALLCLGADMKNNIAITIKDKIIVSQYSGNLSEFDNYLRFEEKINDFLNFYHIKPSLIVCDKHPEYFSTSYAKEHFNNIYQTQHHKAHFGSVILEHHLKEAIGVVLDGTGFGDDGNIWGGEFFVLQQNTINRIGHFKYMPFDFGDMAIKQPFRLALLWLKNLNITNHRLFEQHRNIAGFLNISKNTLKTSSVGRLFDVVSALLDVANYNHYEGYAAIKLMEKAFYSNSKEILPYRIKNFDIDFSDTIKVIANRTDQQDCSKAFHNTLIEAITKNIQRISASVGIKTVALSGGVFQNTILLEGLIKRLSKNNFKVYFNSELPINDGGVCFGQVWMANNFAED